MDYVPRALIMNDKKIFYNLQVCRGIAAFIVVMAHANLLMNKELFNGFLIIGWNGVDFFFILSGFIIYYVNAKYLGFHSKISEYFSKRLARIYPIYWVYTLVVLLLDVLLYKSTNRHIVDWIDLSAVNIFKSFILYPTDTASNQMPVLPVAWTLSYEIFFYIIFGLCMFANKKVFWTLSFLWVLAILARGLGFIAVKSHLLSFILNEKNVEFLFGCVIAELSLANRTISRKYIDSILLIFGISLLLLSWINEALGLIWFQKLDVLNFGIPYSIIIYSLICL